MRTPEEILAELGELLKLGQVAPKAAASSRDREPRTQPGAVDWDRLDALGEPDRDGPWLVAGRRAVWGQA